MLPLNKWMLDSCELGGGEDEWLRAFRNNAFNEYPLGSANSIVALARRIAALWAGFIVFVWQSSLTDIARVRTAAARPLSSAHVGRS